MVHVQIHHRNLNAFLELRVTVKGGDSTATVVTLSQTTKNVTSLPQIP